MKKLIVCLLVLMSSSSYAQSYFSKVYPVKLKNKDTLNMYPNFLLSVLELDSFIYAVGYSADTSHKNNEDEVGTGFYKFDLNGELVEYYRVPDPEGQRFSPQAGLCTFDGINFYTGIHNRSQSVSILGFNFLTKEFSTRTVYNSLNPGGYITNTLLQKTEDSCFIIMSTVEPPEGFQYKIQITKIGIDSKIHWQKIVGKPTSRYYINFAYSTYKDLAGNYYFGIGYDNYNGIINYPKFESIVYKFSPDGYLLRTYNSPPSQGFGPVYDICIDEEQTIFLACDTIWTPNGYPSAAASYGAIQVLDSNMNFKRLLIIDNKRTGQFGILNPIKLINSNDNKDLIGAFRGFVDDTFLYPGVPWPYLHTIINLKQIRKDGSLKWSRNYRIREGRDDGLVYDLKGDQDKQGYYIAAFSYKYMDEDSITEPYYMPWLLHVDNDGCVVPGCANLVQTDSALPVEKKNYFLLYPVPADDMLTLYHEESKVAHISIRNETGVLVDELTTATGSETILIPLQHYASGLYFVTMTTADGHHSTKSFVKN